MKNKMQVSVQRDSSTSERTQENSETSEHPFIEGFKQQMLKAWLPIPSLTKTIVLFFIMTVIFLGIGIPMIILSNNIVETTTNEYGSLCSTNQTNCAVTFTIPQTMKAPVFVFYELKNFYQNHRLYANSISYKQLGGQDLSVADVQTACKPMVTNANIGKTLSINGTALDPAATANPCGMVAYTVFNDTFDVLYPNGTSIPISTDGIAWPSDVQKYSSVNAGKMWYNISDPRFMNWIRISTMPSFRKLWGKISTDLLPGTYTVKINNYYIVSQFNTEKYFVLSTSNFFGARNQFLSIIYLAMGGLCLCIAVGFCVKKIKKDKNDHHE